MRSLTMSVLITYCFSVLLVDGVGVRTEEKVEVDDAPDGPVDESGQGGEAPFLRVTVEH